MDWNNETVGNPALLAQVLKVRILPQTYVRQVAIVNADVPHRTTHTVLATTQCKSLTPPQITEHYIE